MNEEKTRKCLPHVEHIRGHSVNHNIYIIGKFILRCCWVSSLKAFCVLYHDDFFSFLCTVLYIVVVLFLLAIVLSVLPFTDSDYPSGIFKLFFHTCWGNNYFPVRCVSGHWLFANIRQITNTSAIINIAIKVIPFLAY